MSAVLLLSTQVSIKVHMDEAKMATGLVSMHCMRVKFYSAGNGSTRDNAYGTADARPGSDSGVMQAGSVAHFWAERLDGLLFSLHDVRQGGIARLVQPEISCDDGGQPT